MRLASASGKAFGLTAAAILVENDDLRFLLFFFFWISGRGRSKEAGTDGKAWNVRAHGLDANEWLRITALTAGEVLDRGRPRVQRKLAKQSNLDTEENIAMSPFY